MSGARDAIVKVPHLQYTQTARGSEQHNQQTSTIPKNPYTKRGTSSKGTLDDPPGPAYSPPKASGKHYQIGKSTAATTSPLAPFLVPRVHSTTVDHKKTTQQTLLNRKPKYLIVPYQSANTFPPRVNNRVSQASAPRDDNPKPSLQGGKGSRGEHPAAVPKQNIA